MDNYTPSCLDLLKLDIDTRILDVWRAVELVDEWSVEVVVAMARMAYGQGYTDALTEKKKGQLYTDHGFEPPKVR